MPRETKETKRARARRIVRALRALYPDSRCSLDFRNPFELVIAVILSAQCTDATVNKVTPGLFARWPTPQALADAPQAEVERVVRPTGYYSAKARNIRGAAAMIAERHGGRVPETMEELVELPGVGRKTANVVLWNAHGKNEGIAVDTHVLRIAKRLALATTERPEKTERELADLVPRNEWGHLTHLLIDHGRAVCVARSPRCESCRIAALCPTGPRVLAARAAARTRS
ncbi:MAG TPA: endonuclease III [Candidatus Thermoplasmatota archaeon]|nr:endonuclease III [Candidatus Thermoplasmatota archaeon]